MRISGGKARGVTLRIDKKAVHRPAMDRLRQGIFSSIGPAIGNAHVCDLFAGTGSYGLEALSRGASTATFVEINRRAIAMIKDNVAIASKSMREKLDTSIITTDVLKWKHADAPPFDIIFVDPPYEIIAKITPSLFELFTTILAPNGLIVFETPGQIDPTFANWHLRKRIGKGKDQSTACLIQRIEK